MSTPDPNTALIPFAHRPIGDDTVPTVNGVDLHAFLGATKDYTSWVKVQIKRAKLVENIDYIIFTQEGEKGRGRPSLEYHFTFDAATCIGMISSAKKGDEVRRYFIKAEKDLQALRQNPIPVVHDTRTKVAIETLLRLDEAEYRLQQLEEDKLRTEAQLDRAETKADMALSEAHRMTIEEYIGKNGLLRQFPENTWVGAARWLQHFCHEYGLPTHKVPVWGKSWETELAYPLQALAAWVRHASRTRHQDGFRIEEDGVFYGEKE